MAVPAVHEPEPSDPVAGVLPGSQVRVAGGVIVMLDDAPVLALPSVATRLTLLRHIVLDLDVKCAAKTGASSSITLNPPATLTWDPGKTPATGSDGTGSWTAGTAIWASGGSDVAWIPGDNALIGVGGTPGTIKTYAVTVANITFNQTASGGYTLSAGQFHSSHV